MGNDNGVGLSPAPWLASGSPTVPLPSARLMPPTPALEFPLSADLTQFGLASPTNYTGSLMSPSVTGMLVSAPQNNANPLSRANSTKINTSGAVQSNSLEGFAQGAGGYDPPTTSPSPTPGPDVKTSQPQSSQPVSSSAVAAAVTAAQPRPPITTTAVLQQQQQPQSQQPPLLRKNSLVSGAQPPQQPSYAKYASSNALPANDPAATAAAWTAGVARRRSMGLMPSPPAVNVLGPAGTTPTTMPVTGVPGLDATAGGVRIYSGAAGGKDMMSGAGSAVTKPLSPGDAHAVAVCKEKAARVGDEFARKRKLQMEAENKRNPKKLKLEKRPEEMTKEELKKKSYAHRLFLNRQSAAVSRVRRQAYVKFLEESLSEIELAKYRQENQIGNLREENSKLKAQLQQMQNRIMTEKQGLSQASQASQANYPYTLTGQRSSSRYSRRSGPQRL